MLKTPLSQQHYLNGFKLTKALTPLTLGAALLTSASMPAEAIPVVIQSSPPSTYIYGSPIPTAVPVNPVTGQVYSGSSYNPPVYNYRSYDPVITPGGGVIRNSTLINPTVINSRVSGSVLVDPVIVNSPRYPYGYGGYGYGGYGYGTYRQSPYYNPGGVRVRIGF